MTNKDDQIDKYAVGPPPSQLTTYKTTWLVSILIFRKVFVRYTVSFMSMTVPNGEKFKHYLM